MLETILKLSDTRNHPFYEKIDFFKNHNLYFGQVSTPAWGYHVVTNFRCTPKRVVQYLVHNARKLYCSSLFGTIRKLNFKKGPKSKFRSIFGRLPKRKDPMYFWHLGFRGFLFHPSFTLIFCMVPNKLAQCNFRAL